MTKDNDTKKKQTTPKPGELFPANLKRFAGERAVHIIEHTDSLELSNHAITSTRLLAYIGKFIQVREYVIALTYGGNNIPRRPRMTLIRKAESLAEELGEFYACPDFWEDLEATGYKLTEDEQDEYNLAKDMVERGY